MIALSAGYGTARSAHQASRQPRRTKTIENTVFENRCLAHDILQLIIRIRHLLFEVLRFFA